MKLASLIFLFVFITFLMTPTIVSVLEISTNDSIAYSISEEDQLQKEITPFFYFDTTDERCNLARLTSSLILSENLAKHDNITASIFIPPPEQV